MTNETQTNDFPQFCFLSEVLRNMDKEESKSEMAMERAIESGINPEDFE